MRRNFQRIGQSALWVVALACLAAGPSVAAIFTLEFDGLQDTERVRHYYDNGYGNLGSGPGDNYGVYFSNNAMVRYGYGTGGSGYFPQSATPYGAMTFDQGTSTYAMITGGFDTGLSFHYSTLSSFASVSVYSGINASGALLASLDLPGSASTGGWHAASLTFSGTAQTVVFTGTANQTAIDDLTFGSGEATNPVPEPASLILLGSGLIGLSLTRRSRSKR